MELRRNTTAGVLYWTPAPVRNSPTSTDYEAEEVEEEQAEMEDDFTSQMDKNGIIGLSEAFEDVGLRETWCGGEAEFKPAGYSGPLTPENVEPGCDRERSPEEQCHNLRGHLVTEIAEGAQILSSVLFSSSFLTPSFNILKGLYSYDKMFTLESCLTTTL